MTNWVQWDPWNERKVLESGRQEGGSRKGIRRAGMTSGITREETMWRRPTTERAGMTSWVVEEVAGNVEEVRGEGSQMACGCIEVR